MLPSPRGRDHPFRGWNRTLRGRDEKIRGFFAPKRGRAAPFLGKVRSPWGGRYLPREGWEDPHEGAFKEPNPAPRPCPPPAVESPLNSISLERKRDLALGSQLHAEVLKIEYFILATRQQGSWRLGADPS